MSTTMEDGRAEEHRVPHRARQPCELLMSVREHDRTRLE
jgi:hypothetical protein